MSPVTTIVSGPFGPFLKVTVVSSVLGRQLENSHASSGSRIFAEMDSIAASTALLRKRRTEEAGRFEANLFCAKAPFGTRAEEAMRADAVLTNWRRESPNPVIIDWSLFIL